MKTMLFIKVAADISHGGAAARNHWSSKMGEMMKMLKGCRVEETAEAEQNH